MLPARPGDLDAVYRIAEACFPLPWPLEELRKELARPFSGLRVLRPAGVTNIVGFLNYWRIADELQLMNIAVTPTERGRGHGRALLADLFELGHIHAATSIVLEVRPSNGVAIRLYERHGFERVGVRPRYYSDNGEDALLMRVSLRPR
ncbi:MAG: ribosomal protein S18-alanine N-acetyltransferase [Polyangiales bacterium]